VGKVTRSRSDDRIAPQTLEKIETLGLTVHTLQDDRSDTRFIMHSRWRKRCADVEAKEKQMWKKDSSVSVDHVTRAMAAYRNPWRVPSTLPNSSKRSDFGQGSGKHISARSWLALNCAASGHGR